MASKWREVHRRGSVCGFLPRGGWVRKDGQVGSNLPVHPSRRMEYSHPHSGSFGTGEHLGGGFLPRGSTTCTRRGIFLSTLRSHWWRVPRCTTPPGRRLGENHLVIGSDPFSTLDRVPYPSTVEGGSSFPFPIVRPSPPVIPCGVSIAPIGMERNTTRRRNGVGCRLRSDPSPSTLPEWGWVDGPAWRLGPHMGESQSTHNRRAAQPRRTCNSRTGRFLAG